MYILFREKIRSMITEFDWQIGFSITRSPIQFYFSMRWSLKVRGLDYHSMLLNIMHGHIEGERDEGEWASDRTSITV